jgi:transketolase
LGEDGATHQVLEDLGMMKMLPGMTVINPCDYNQTKAATIAIAEHDGPVYLRFGRPVIPVFTDSDQKFEIGKAWMVNEGTDVSIFATGHLVWEAIQAGEMLEAEGINAEIINIHTIKPLDEKAILASVKKTGVDSETPCAVGIRRSKRFVWRKWYACPIDGKIRSFGQSHRRSRQTCYC